MQNFDSSFSYSAKDLQDLSIKLQIPLIELEILFLHLLGKPKTHLIISPQATLSSALSLRFAQLLRLRLDKVPLAYLINTAYFWNLALYVNEAVLIPRSETELLVERALEIIPINRSADILELGTGSGAIALAIATERPLANIVATDVSAAALQVAKLNAIRLSINNIKFLCSNWWNNKFFYNFPKFDLIISNPPYIASGEKFLCDLEIFFEPKLALFAQQQGLRCLEQIIFNSIKYLRPPGFLLLEHGFKQQSIIVKKLQVAGFSTVQCCKDLSGIDRVVIATWR